MKEDKIAKRRVIEQVVAYKYIPRHMHIISFLNMGYFVNKIVELRINVLFCITFEKAYNAFIVIAFYEM